MPFSPARRIAAIAAVCALALTLVVSSAGAYNDPFGGRDLPGHTWAGSGVYAGGLFFTMAEDESTSSVCVGPIVKSGGGYVAPYGWACKPTIVSWEYPELTGEPAVYNPNPGTFAVFRAIAFFR